MNSFKHSSYLWCGRQSFNLLIFISLIFITTDTYALGLSTFRIYLDNQQRSYDFVVFNKDNYEQECIVGLRHYTIDDRGNKTLAPDDVIPAHSAKSLIKFSPRRFKVESGQSQNIRFRLRRKANQEIKEYRSYFSLDCGISKKALKNTQKNTIALHPKLRHNLPVIVRTGNVTVALKFTNIEITSNSSLHALLSKEGKRSVYGDIELIDTRSNKVISKKPQASIHLEAQTFEFTLSTNNVNPQFLKLRFTENIELGGDQLIESDVL